MLKRSANGFEYIEISNKAANAKIALQGAHIFHYQRKDEKPILWLSGESDFELGKAIRGGVPICWPSFGNNNPELPQHGFARVMAWRLEKIEELDQETTRAVFVLEDSEQSRRVWNYKFLVYYTVTIADKLTMELKTINLDDKPFILTQALHTYFAVSSIEEVEISGLQNKRYLDALTLTQEIQDGVIIFDQEVDRVYQGADQEIALKDAKRKIRINNGGSNSVVVWNPWREKCSRMTAMKPDAYKEFVCIESANAYDDKRMLQPQEVHVLEAQIS